MLSVLSISMEMRWINVGFVRDVFNVDVEVEKCEVFIKDVFVYV